MNLPDPELLEIYRAEQAEHVQRMRSVVGAIRPPHADPAAIEELFRRVHTLKGASRAAGFAAIELLTHALEGALAKIRAGDLQFTARLQTLVSRSLDAIEDILAAAIRGQQTPMVDGLLGEIAEVAETRRLTPPAAAESLRRPATEIPESAAPVGSSEFVRINAEYLDELMSASSEIIASSMGDESEAARQALMHADEASREWSRLRQDAAVFLRHHQEDAEFAPILEFVHSAEKSFQSLLSETRSQAVTQQRLDWERRRLANQLDQTAARVRMVSADSVFGGFGAMLRQLAKDEGKQIDYRAEGLELPADRIVLQAMKDPVMHLLRNAVSHGVEPAEVRTAAGKPDAATIRLLIHSQGDRLQITVEDDGKGLDREALLAEAVRRGLLSNEAEVAAESLADLIFLPGLSTSSVTTLSGRGMGLAIVQHEVTRFHGEIQVRSLLGRGTAITLSLPLSVSSQSALLVEVGGNTYAILSSFVQQLRRVRPSDIQIFDGKPVIVLESRAVPLSRLSDLLDLSASKKVETPGNFQTVVVTAAGRSAALVVDRLADVREVIIKPLGLPAEKAGFAAGAIALSDGSVGLILKTAELLDRTRKISVAQIEALRPAVQEKPVPTILVVDDSMTTRSLERSLLEAHGFHVRLAVDGVEALETLRRQPVDLVITDLMMPRMDGFQLLEQIRKDPALAQLPVIIVSSVENRADQERGLALGADAYIAKRKFDQRELLDTVRQIL